MLGVSAADAVDSALVALTGAGVEQPRLDAELLVAHALGTDRAGLRIDPGRVLDAPGTRWLRDAVRRRAIEREPIAYILGTKGFRHIELAVDPRVLIPRPETERLVEAVLGLPHGVRVHDVGTGSGAVALAIKHERPDLDVSGSDLSTDAIDAARGNAVRLGLDVEFVVADLITGIDAALDAVVSNPPYIAEADRSTLAPEITRHEPELALYAEADGLGVIRTLVTQAAATKASLLAIEVGAGQSAGVRGLVAAAGFTEVETILDLASIERVVVGRR